MPHIACNVEYCKYNKDGECVAEWVDIAEENCMTLEKKVGA